jgi:hypothetical protein
MSVVKRINLWARRDWTIKVAPGDLAATGDIVRCGGWHDIGAMDAILGNVSRLAGGDWQRHTAIASDRASTGVATRPIAEQAPANIFLVDRCTNADRPDYHRRVLLYSLS